MTKQSYCVYFAVFAVNIITFSAGGSWSWTSPILPKLNSDDPNINPLDNPITTFEGSWIAAITNFGATVGPLAGGYFSEKFGKKRALLIIGVCFIAAHTLCALAVNVHFFLIARFLMGLGCGTVFSVVPGYVGDISENSNRGLLGSMLGVFNCLGILFMYAVGPFLSIRAFSVLNLIAPIGFYILFGIVPESPYDLVQRRRVSAAELSLMKLRGKSASEVQKELEYINDSFEECSGETTTFLNMIKSKPLLKALGISNTLMLIQQLSGIGAVLAYMQNIFESTGSLIPSVYSVILIGVIQLVANIVCSQLVEKAGRKLLLIISNVFSAISLLVLGGYFYMISLNVDVTQIGWLPIASLILYIVAFNLGIANIPWIILAELFPSNMKALSSTITTSFCFGLSFLVNMCFPVVSQTIGMTGVFWIFAGILSFGFLFSIMVVPETKGKSSQEIQNMLEGVKK